jgi:hypothetical protein
LGVPSLRVFAVSARQALIARQSAHAAALAGSGLLALETALAELLAEERGRVFLVALLDRAVRLVDEALVLSGLGRKAR